MEKQEFSHWGCAWCKVKYPARRKAPWHKRDYIDIMNPAAGIVQYECDGSGKVPVRIDKKGRRIKTK